MRVHKLATLNSELRTVFFMDSSLFQEHSIKFSRFFATGSTDWHPVQPVQPIHRVSRCRTLIFGNYFDHISLFQTRNCVLLFFMDSSLFQEHSVKFSRFFAIGLTSWQPVQPVHRVSWCKTLILVILRPKSYMAQAYKLQIGFGQCCGPILGLGLGSLHPTMNPYGFLVVKQAEN